MTAPLPTVFQLTLTEREMEAVSAAVGFSIAIAHNDIVGGISCTAVLRERHEELHALLTRLATML